MSYRVEFEPEAIADLDRMASSVQERILRKINWLALLASNYQDDEAVQVRAGTGASDRLATI